MYIPKGVKLKTVIVLTELYIFYFSLTLRECDGKDVGEYVAMARGKTSKAELIVEGMY